MALTQSSPKYWAPNQRVLDYLTNTVIPKDAKVLDIGPGHAPFARANVSVDFVDVPGVANLVKCDLANDPLPFADMLLFHAHIVSSFSNYPPSRETTARESCA